MFIIFSDFLMVEQIFISPKVRRPKSLIRMLLELQKSRPHLDYGDVILGITHRESICSGNIRGTFP